VQFVVFSHSRRLRCRPASPPEAVALNPHRPSSALQRPARAPGLSHHRNTGGRSCPPTQEFTPRSRR
jgi:hypothetical protein